MPAGDPTGTRGAVRTPTSIWSRNGRSGRPMQVGAIVLAAGLALAGAGCSKDEAPPVSTGSATSSPATSAPGSSTTAAPGSTAGPATSASSTTSTTATTSTSSTTAPTTTGPGAPAGLILRGDGLGIVAFGTPEAAAESALRAALGDPADDSGWMGPDAAFPGRVVTWPGLVALFHEGSGGRVFDGWISPVVPGESGPMYATGQGLARGMSYDDMVGLVGGLGFSREGFEGSTGICYPDHGATVCAVFDPPILGDETRPPGRSSRRWPQAHGPEAAGRERGARPGPVTAGTGAPQERLSGRSRARPWPARSRRRGRP